MAIAEVTILPVGVGISLSPYVAQCQKILSEQDKIRYVLNPMGTVLEGNIDDIFEVIRKMQESVFSKNCKRVYSVIKIDDRRDKQDHHMEDKIKSVNEKL